MWFFLYVWKKNGCIDCFPEMEKHTGQQEQEAGDDEYVLGVKKWEKSSLWGMIHFLNQLNVSRIIIK